MKRSLLLVYAVCATLMIAGSLLWFIFTLRSDSQLGKAEALKNFKEFTKRTADILYEPYTQHDPARLQALLEQLCRNHHTHLQTVLIRNESGTLFVWPKNADIFSFNGQNNVEVKNMPLFFIAAQTHIPGQHDSENFTVHAALQTLSVENIFNRGQTVFILILILFLMTMTLLIISYLDILPAEKKMERFINEENEIVPPTAAPKSEPIADSAEIPLESAESPPAAEPEPVSSFSTQLESLDRLHIYNEQPQPNQRGIDDDTDAELLDEVYAVSDFNAENYGAFENYTHHGRVAKQQPPVQPIISFENTPLADVSVQEKHSLERAKLIEELTTAITETAVAEEDLTLLLIHADDLAHNQRVIHSVRTTLDRIHKIFIFNENTLGLIIFYASLDRAMQIASKLYDDVHTLLEACNRNSLGIGLTTRAGRLIPAHRMIEEATAAIEKATEQGADPIVAFRVNPEKYRRCLARLN